MKFNLNRNMKAMLKNNIVLYVVFFIALTNVFGYLMINDFDAVMLFFLVGFLTSYFSKNMIIVLLTAILSTNLLIGSKKASGSLLLEGMKGNKGEEDDEQEDEEDDKKKDDEEDEDEKFTTLKPLSPASIDKNKSDTGLDYTGSLEAAYDNLDKLLSSDALSKMSKDTQTLAEKQNKLMGNINKLTPMIQSAQDMMSSLDNNKIEGLMEKFLTKK